MRKVISGNRVIHIMTFFAFIDCCRISFVNSLSVKRISISKSFLHLFKSIVYNLSIWSRKASIG